MKVSFNIVKQLQLPGYLAVKGIFARIFASKFAGANKYLKFCN